MFHTDYHAMLCELILIPLQRRVKDVGEDGGPW
jgi:hypothetical protein